MVVLLEGDERQKRLCWKKEVAGAVPWSCLFSFLCILFTRKLAALLHHNFSAVMDPNIWPRSKPDPSLL